MSDAPGSSAPYRGYDVLDKWDSPSWDDATRDVIRERLSEIPERRFLTSDEWDTLSAVCDLLIPQPDRPREAVPIAPWIDRKLERDERDGYRYADMPPLREAWRLGLRGIAEETQLRHGKRFAELSGAHQHGVLVAIQKGEVLSGVWARLPAKRFFTGTLLKSVVAEYYAHPAAWSEVGFGGPASPRGYVRLGQDQRDPWEAEEHE